MTQQNYTPWLNDETKMFITPDISPVKRVVVAAANFHPKLDVMLVGARHWDMVMRKQLEMMEVDVPSSEWLQGFIDQYGFFLTRQEAKRICVANGQTMVGDDWGDELYSENLY